MKNLIFFLAIIYGSNVYSNESLWNIWSDETNHDTIRLNAIKSHIWEKFLFINPDTAFQLSELQYKLAEEKGQVKHMAIALNTQGITHVIRGNRKSGREYYEKSLELFRSIGDNKGIANTLNNLGMLFSDVGDYKTSIEYHMESLKIKKEINDLRGIASTLNNIGVIYNDQKDYGNSLKFAKRSLEARADDDYRGIASSLNNIATVYYVWADSIRKIGDEVNAVKMASQALLYHKRSAKLRNENKDFLGLASSYLNIGLVYKIGGDYNEAMKYVDMSINLHKSIGDKTGLSESLEKKASIYFDQQDYSKAITHAEQSLVLARDVGGLLQTRDAAKVLYNSYKLMGSASKALQMHELYVRLSDSIHSMENQKAIINQTYKYEYEKAQIIKENEAKEHARNEAEQTRRRNNLQYSLIFLGILVLFGMVLGLGFIKVSPNAAEGLIFFAFLILFEFILVFTEPYLEQYTQGQPMYNLLANSVLAIMIFPVHAILEKLLKKRIVKMQ